MDNKSKQEILEAIFKNSSELREEIVSDKQEVLEAISMLADTVQELSDRTQSDMGKMHSDMGKMQSGMGKMQSDMGKMQSDIVNIKATMVTKDYLDEKIGQLRGDLVALARKGNTKLSTLVEELVVNGTLRRDIADRILALEPFPQ